MARRKVTMLEAFQRSAQDSADRLAAERRRIVADREKEIRRAETTKAAQEIGARISQRAGDGVGSLIASLRGGATGQAAVIKSQDAIEEAADGGHSVPSPADPATDISVAQSVPGEGAPKREGPALPAFDSASRDDIAPVEPTMIRKSAEGERHEPASLESDAHLIAQPELPSGASQGAQALEAAEEALAADDAEDEVHPYEDATSEEVDEAMAALQDDVFELPMTSRAFALLSVAVLATVFLIGFRFGRRGESPVQAAGPGLAALPGAASGALGASEFPRPEPVGTPYGGRSRTNQNSETAAGSARPAPGPAAIPTLQAEVVPGPKAPTGPVLTAADRAFRDPAMAFTIMAITYTRTEAHAAMAQETYDQLDQEGFPVIHPIERDSRIYVFVGAAGSMGELEELKADLRGLRSGRSGTPEFRSAYLVNIDSYR